MPELPEVETVRRSLVKPLVGRVIDDIIERAFPDVMGPQGVPAAKQHLRNREITGLRRYGKYLFVDLSPASERPSLVHTIMIHLRMTGQLHLVESDNPPIRFEHLAFKLDGPPEDLRFTDQRKFGRVLPMSSSDEALLRSRLGPEPFEPRFSLDYVIRTLRGRRAPIKALILDQRILVGVGNIYADEALFLAGIHPATRAGELTGERIAALRSAIIGVLEQGIRNRGTTFSSFQDAYGDAGSNFEALRVYGRGRKREPCPRCHQPLAAIPVAGRTSHFCPICQPVSVGVSR